MEARNGVEEFRMKKTRICNTLMRDRYLVFTMRAEIKQTMRFLNYECCGMRSDVKSASGAEGRNNATSSEIPTQKI